MILPAIRTMGARTKAGRLIIFAGLKYFKYLGGKLNKPHPTRVPKIMTQIKIETLTQKAHNNPLRALFDDLSMRFITAQTFGPGHPQNVQKGRPSRPSLGKKAMGVPVGLTK